MQLFAYCLHIQRIQLYYYQMRLRTSENTVQEVIGKIDNEIWSSIADKAIAKMPKFKLTTQSERMFNDFAILNSDGFIKSAGKIEEENEQLITFKENLIVGTSKMEQSSRSYIVSSMPQQVPHAKNKKRLVSAIELNNNKKSDVVNKGNLFRLTMSDQQNLEEQKIQDTLRTAKYDNIRYNQSLEEHEKQRRAMSEHRSLVQKKKFKEMKTFTYDYEGKLISLGNEKNANSKIHIVNMKPHFGNHIKTLRNSNQKMMKHQNILQILNKRVIGAKTPVAELSRQSQKQKQERGSRHAKILHETPNILEYFKEEDKVEVGVIITDINNKSKFVGANRDKNQIKNAKHIEFKGEFKQLEKFREKLIFKKLKFRDQRQQNAIRTEYIESSNAQKMKTEVTEKESKVFTSATGYTNKRGRIDIKNQRLYTQNFIQDID